MWTKFRDWYPAVGASCLVLVAVAYVLVRQGEVAEGIRRMGELGALLTTTADTAAVGVRTPGQIEAQIERLRDLASRFADSRRGGVVVPQLSEATRAAGLTIASIEPLSVAPRSANQGERKETPKYRFTVSGDYRRIAQYMDECVGQRIPVRVVGFRINRGREIVGLDQNTLQAEIVVEAFQSVGGAKEAGA